LVRMTGPPLPTTTWAYSAEAAGTVQLLADHLSRYGKSDGDAPGSCCDGGGGSKPAETHTLPLSPTARRRIPSVVR